MDSPNIGSDVLKTLENGIKINISGSLPGEALMTAVMQYGTTVRQTMEPALLARFDSIMVQQMEDLQKIWRGIWVAVGLLK